MDQERAAQTAQRLIRENGRQVTLVTASTTPADSDAPWDGPTPGRETRRTVWATVTEYEDRAVDGEEIMRGDRMLIIPALEMGGEHPKNYEQIIDGDDTWRQVGTREVRPGPVPIVYKVQARL